MKGILLKPSPGNPYRDVMDRPDINLSTSESSNVMTVTAKLKNTTTVVGTAVTTDTTSTDNKLTTVLTAFSEDGINVMYQETAIVTISGSNISLSTTVNVE